MSEERVVIDVNESKKETFSVYKVVDAGDVTQDIYYLEDITGTLSEVKRKAKEFGKVKNIDLKKREILVERVVIFEE